MERIHEIVVLAMQGHSHAWDELVPLYQGRLYSCLYGMTSDREGSYDLLQDTFREAISNIRSLRDPSHFQAWLYTIAYRQAQAYWKRKGRTSERQYAEFSGELEDPNNANPLELLIQREQEESILAAVKKLPSGCRACFLMFYMDGLGQQEIAGILTIDVNTVKSQLHYARKKLKEALSGSAHGK